MDAPRKPTDLTARDLSWFAQRVQRGQSEIFSETVTITPDIAKRLLEVNDANRTISWKYVKAIARDITNRHYELNGEAIIVSKEGYLNNGQHRLLAVIEANSPIQTIMTFGVTRSSRRTVDMGRARTVANYLNMEGVASYSSCAAIASMWLGYSLNYYGKVSKTNLVTKQDSLAFYERNKDDIDKAVALFRGRTKAIRCNVTEIGTAYCILRRMDPVHVEGFFGMLIDGANLDPDDPILWLRNKLIGGGDLTTWNRLEYILRYWIAWRNGDKTKRHVPLYDRWPSELRT